MFDHESATGIAVIEFSPNRPVPKFNNVQLPEADPYLHCQTRSCTAVPKRFNVSGAILYGVLSSLQ